MADQDRERLLAAFADHLLRNRLTDEKRGRFMVNWVRRFLAYPPPIHGATEEDCLQAYLHVLETEHAHVETTMIYTHVAKGLRAPSKSPLDLLG